MRCADRLALAGETDVLESAFVHGSSLYPQQLAEDPSTFHEYDPETSLKVDGVERSAAYGLVSRSFSC